VSYEIYLITAPGYWYVGSTTRGADERFKEHKRGKSIPFHAQMREIGVDNFSMVVLESGTGDPLAAERGWYDLYAESEDHGSTLNARRPSGWPEMTPEVCAKIAATKTGVLLSETHKRNIGLSSRGRACSPETRAKMSAAHKGKVLTPEHRAQISKAHKGKPLTQEHKDKLSQAQKRHYADRAKTAESLTPA
jgi:hypothetical protein